MFCLGVPDTTFLQKMKDSLKRNSSLSPKTLDSLPSLGRVDATFRNINWLLHYWTCKPPVRISDEGGNQNASESSPWDYSVCYPHPVCEEYGFKYRTCKKQPQDRSRGKKRGAGDADDENGTSKRRRKPQGSMSAVQWLDDEDGNSGSSSGSGE